MQGLPWWFAVRLHLSMTPRQRALWSLERGQSSFLPTSIDQRDLCAFRHCIQNSADAILDCHQARSTNLLLWPKKRMLQPRYSWGIGALFLSCGIVRYRLWLDINVSRGFCALQAHLALMSNQSWYRTLPYDGTVYLYLMNISAVTIFFLARVVLPWPKKKTATWIYMYKIRTLFLSWDIEKPSLIALRCSDAWSGATVPISWYCVIRTVFWFYA